MDGLNVTSSPSADRFFFSHARYAIVPMQLIVFPRPTSSHSMTEARGLSSRRVIISTSCVGSG